MKHIYLWSGFNVKGIIILVCVDYVSPLLEGPQSLSGKDLSENLKGEA